MGIRFRCPNGHKLNVKSFLAGKRGVCPDCGQTFRIPPDGTDDSNIVAMPLDSRRNGSARGGESLEESDFETAVAVAAAAVTEPVTAASEGVVFLPPMPTPQSSAPAQTTAPAVPVGVPATAPQFAAETSPASQPASRPVQPRVPSGVPEIFFPPAAATVTAKPAPAPVNAPAPAPSPALPPAPAPVDPIAEAPNAVWYVRPPNGGQYGPARSDVMRKWIAEGRVSSDSLVWRDGWTDWRDAGHLFPALAVAPSSAAATHALPPATNSAAPARTSSLRPGDRKSTGKRSNDFAVAALVCLVLVCLILVTVLVVVLSQGSA